MKQFFLNIFFLAFSYHLSAQSDTAFRFIKTIAGDITSFAVDDLDNIYLLNSKNQLKKLNANGDSVAIFNDVKRFGKASLIDVSNPLKVLLYYKDFATVIVLDRFLNLKNTIDLRKQNIFQVKTISQSYDNKIWLYDDLESKLKKIDEDGKLLFETPDFRLLFDESLSPQSITDADQNIYIYDSAKAVYVFDYYGSLKNKILISRWQNFKVAGKYIFGSVADTLYRYEIKKFRYDEWSLPKPLQQAKSFSFTSSKLYALKQNEISIWAFR